MAIATKNAFATDTYAIDEFDTGKNLSMRERNAIVRRVLAQENLTRKKLSNAGLRVLIGELTGAGRKVPVSRLKGIIIDEELIHDQQISRVILNNPRRPMLSNVKGVKVGRDFIAAQDIVGAIVQRR